MTPSTYLFIALCTAVLASWSVKGQAIAYWRPGVTVAVLFLYAALWPLGYVYTVCYWGYRLHKFLTR